MHIAVVNKATGYVENVVVPPQGANVWFGPGEGYDAIQTEVGAIGDKYENGEFLPPAPPPAE